MSVQSLLFCPFLFVPPWSEEMRNGKILVLSGNRFVRTCLHLILMASTGHEITTAAWDSRARLPAVAPYDLVILDLSDPAHLPWLHSQLSHQPAATSTICMVPPASCGADLVGQTGVIYVSSSSDAVQLLELIELELDRARTGASLPSPPRSSFDLTAKEEAILRLVAKGLSNQQIARQLAIAEPTVRVHKHHVMRKLGIRGAVQLHRFACSL
ncbi:helix-turn-helix transcriptional regulator [Ramlibacter humi]|uniref:Response regulator transcription factor n=1 Tax=Ramlibacter humi TaxID=2530451 RepID=A0A4Z0BMS0_9BURK|nr:response regulator transcription factor [Ramlibacter humi]TFZ00072.1 response regulator transcription factor [Ramlibacter humi]